MSHPGANLGVMTLRDIVRALAAAVAISVALGLACSIDPPPGLTEEQAQRRAWLKPRAAALLGLVGAAVVVFVSLPDEVHARFWIGEPL